jgi:hypothetical protein
VKVATWPVGRKSIVPLPDSSGDQSIVAVGLVIVIVSVPGATLVCVAPLLELMLPLKAWARAACGIMEYAAIAAEAQDANHIFLPGWA